MCIRDSLGLDIDLDLVCLGQHGDGRRRGVDAALALGLGHTLHAMHAALELHGAIDAIAQHLERDLFETAHIGRRRVDDLDLPLLALGETLVHAEEVTREDVCLVATGTTADLDDDVLLVVGVGRQEQELDGLLELRQLCLLYTSRCV